MKRNRVTITVREDMLRAADRLINDLTIRNRSQAIEYLLAQTLASYRISGALILAGGATIGGTPRMLLEVDGRPIGEHIIDELKRHGVTQFVVYVDRGGENIIDRFGDGKKFGVEIKYMPGERPSGRAAPIRAARNYFDGTFLVWYGDTLCHIDLPDMIRVHRDARALATIALTTSAVPARYGVVQMRGNRIIDFVEKPIKARGHLVSAGIFLVEPELTRQIAGGMTALETDIFPRLAKKGLLAGYPFEGLWLNINDKETLQRANNIWR